MVYVHCMLDTKGLNTYSEYVILIAFALQQYLHERASVLRITCTACLVKFPFRKTVSHKLVQTEM